MTAAVVDAVRIGLVGWRNVVVKDPEVAAHHKINVGDQLPFSPDAIEDAVDYDGLWEIAEDFPNRLRMGDDVKGESPSSPHGTPAPSAGAAVGADVPASPPKPNP